MSKTRQEIFDIAYRGLASQGFRRSTNEANGCAYRGNNGRRCAVGWLIPDSRYSCDIEGLVAHDWDVLVLAGVSREDRAFLEDLQKAHDDAKNCVGVQSRLRNLANRYELTIPEVSL